ncbi:unnamed protein product [Periconia digitata]|uniref:Secreted protein n=1 Tax=Periconia digitata TaxID=1303443 RepID=A0A9W4U9W0_9PLEO|nr:unnamed protein product [Periconia digitata]
MYSIYLGTSLLALVDPAFRLLCACSCVLGCVWRNSMLEPVSTRAVQRHLLLLSPICDSKHVDTSIDFPVRTHPRRTAFGPTPLQHGSPGLRLRRPALSSSLGFGWEPRLHQWLLAITNSS